ncbi:hypothetical protein E2C01_057441 [Portunus trituberculatus]|uniref:Uncharacterized protein n=1 Tax=Portunus trituberculatus TaxID=210409 RepID=A0A5B7H3C6_PORTR|nr:hypothetical protein [Portunus trituberculatus]
MGAVGLVLPSLFQKECDARYGTLDMDVEASLNIHIHSRDPANSPTTYLPGQAEIHHLSPAGNSPSQLLGPETLSRENSEKERGGAGKASLTPPSFTFSYATAENQGKPYPYTNLKQKSSYSFQYGL